MADFLALDWDARDLCGFEAQVGKGGVKIRKAFALEWPAAAGDSADTPAQRGAWLKSELDRLQIGNAPVLVCLPRESAVVRQLEVPDVPDHELPDLVRLQAETKMSTSIDLQLLDFLPMPKRDDTAGREVLLASVPKDMVAGIRQTLSAAGLEVKSVGLSSAAMTELVARAEVRRGFDSSETSLVLARHNRRLEISLVRERHLLFTHSAELSGESESQDLQSALAEVSRSFISIERQLRGAKVARAWVVGACSVNEPLCRALEGRLSCQVHSLEPVTDLDIPFADSDVNGNEGQFAGPLGMLLSLSGAEGEAVDFLNPRKAAKRIDRKTLQMRIAAIAAAAVVLVGGTSLIIWNNSLANQLQAKEREVSDLSAANRAAQPTVASAALVNDWTRRDVFWPDQYRKLNEALPGTDRIFMSNFTFIAAQSKGDEIAGIKATGYAIDRLDVAKLEQKLSNMGYEVYTKPTRPSQKDPKYRWRFDLDLKLKPEKKTTANKKKASTGKRA